MNFGKPLTLGTGLPSLVLQWRVYVELIWYIMNKNWKNIAPRIPTFVWYSRMQAGNIPNLISAVPLSSLSPSITSPDRESLQMFESHWITYTRWYVSWTHYAHNMRKGWGNGSSPSIIVFDSYLCWTDSPGMCTWEWSNREAVCVVWSSTTGIHLYQRETVLPSLDLGLIATL